MQLVSVTENIDETPSGLLLHGIMSSIAEFYSRNLAAEVIKGSVQKAKAGGTVGKAPTGYRNVRKIMDGREVRTVEVDPDRGPLMAWVFEQYATGEWTTRSLLAAVTDKGLTSSGGPRTPSRPLSLSNFCRLLRTPYYMGVITYRGVTYPGAHEPLVIAAIYEQVQDRLSAKHQAGEKQRLHNHYLKGAIVCGQCRSRLCVMNAKNRHGTIYPYFFCLGRQEKRTACTQRVVLIDAVEAKVIEHYATVELSPQQRADVRAFILDQLSDRQREALQEAGRQQRRIGQLTHQRDKLLEAYYAGAVPLAQLKAEQERIGRELEAAQRLLESSQTEFAVVRAKLDAALNLIADCQAAYTAADPQTRRRMNQVFFQRIEISDELEVISELAEPFRLLTHGDVLTAALQEASRPKEGTTYQRQKTSRTCRTLSEAKTEETTPAFAGVGSRNDWLVGEGGLSNRSLVSSPADESDMGNLLTEMVAPRNPDGKAVR